MAENDIELSVGIKLDDAQFSKEYNNLLRNVSADTSRLIKTAVKDETTGPATNDWGQLPFAGMHHKTKGARVAANAFLPSLAQDLQSSGYESGSLAYQSALINAAYRSSMSDPMQRFHRMLAMGLTQQADLTHPDTALGKSIEIDYQLMSQPWSRDFIKQGEKGAYVDFAGMREYAVDAGLGRWIDDESSGVAGTNTADNFELINEELENIEDKLDKNDKWSEEEYIYRTLANDTDKMLKTLVSKLKKAGKLDDTVIVLVSDHYVYGYSDEDYVALKKNVENDRKALQNTPFVIWSSDMEHMEVDTIMDTADILPTMLNLLGIDYNPNMYMGTDVFSTNHDHFVWFADGSYIADKYTTLSHEAMLTKTNYNISKNKSILLTNYYGK